jgi:hypothetical protein
MMKRDAVVEMVECEKCGETAGRILTANICRVSYPDGTTDRFKMAKEKRALDKLKRAAKKSQNSDEVARINTELGNVREVSKRDRQAANICKVSEKE